jgi:hypothetical protein
MNQWVKVVSLPLGLVAFSLYLVFGLLKGEGKKPAWLLPMFLALVSIAIVGGLIAEYGPLRSESKPGAKQEETVRQETKGDQSPVINSRGNATVTYGEKSKPDSPKAGAR